MQESVERFKKTINNLTDVVKLQKENNGEAVMVDLSEVIREVSLDLEPLIKASGAELTVDIADCPAIHFQEKNLRSVIYNLLSNAIKYRAPERVPQVLIHCELTSGYHQLTVKDNGLGMEPRRLDQLFTMFKRFHDHVEGSGIGLYMVKKIVENAGGRIEVESQVGVGSTFRVYFRR
jgi:signal transduction histidine kinase